LQKPFAEQDLLNTILKLLPEKTEDTFQESSTANTILDLDELERISGGDATFFDEMLRIFIRSSEEAIAKIQLNFQNSDWIAIAESAHKLAAPAKHLQAIALYNRLKQLENTAENIRPEEVKGLIDAIEVEINEINLILKQKLKVKTD
jgi:HPt (histidine-containing phosphotransfer) domain-containing protein